MLIKSAQKRKIGIEMLPFQKILRRLKTDTAGAMWPRWVQRHDIFHGLICTNRRSRKGNFALHNIVASIAVARSGKVCRLYEVAAGMTYSVPQASHFVGRDARHLPQRRLCFGLKPATGALMALSPGWSKLQKAGSSQLRRSKLRLCFDPALHNGYKLRLQDRRPALQAMGHAGSLVQQKLVDAHRSTNKSFRMAAPLGEGL
jgi:hypothetical protein